MSRKMPELMTFLITQCRTSKSVKFLHTQRRFSALVQFFGDTGPAAVADIHIPDRQVNTSTDHTIFEPFSDEYVGRADDVPPQLALPPKYPRPRSIHPRWVRSHRFMRPTGLAELVSDGDFARAENLRAELLDAGIQIQRNVVFADAALHAWQSRPVEERSEAFYAWFSLFPNAILGQLRRSRLTLFDVKRRLFSEPTDLNTLACFALIASRKGFANYVCIDIFTHVARFASPRVSSAFFDACEKAALAFYARFKGNTKEDSSFSIWEAEKFHNAFVRSLCLAGHLDEAVERLAYILSKGVPITPPTWIVFLETLSHVGREDLLNIVRQHRATTERSGSEVDSHKPTPTSLSATDISQMMADYIDSGNADLLDQLRKDMIGSGLNLDLWAASLMKYYHGIEQHIVVLRQFIRYYTCVGIPKELIHRYIKQDSPSYQPSFDQTHPSLPIIRPLPSMRGRNRWPSTHAIAMVWQSVSAFAQDLRSLGLLYREFLDYWDRYRPSTTTEHWSISGKGMPSNIRFQYPPIMKPDAVHFHVFITAFARLSGTDAVMQVMSDMHARNIRPDAHTWTVLMGAYTDVDITSAKRILSRMESALPKDAKPAASSMRRDANRTLTGPLARPANWIPGPTLVTYTSMLRGLIDQGKLEEARQFEGRMIDAGYVAGSDERTERVLEVLRERETTPRIPWRRRASWRPGKN